MKLRQLALLLALCCASACTAPPAEQALRPSGRPGHPLNSPPARSDDRLLQEPGPRGGQRASGATRSVRTDRAAPPAAM